MVKDIKPKLGRIVIEEWDPVHLQPTGYDVEILHTQTQTVEAGDQVEPTQQIGTQGDVGAGRGEFHAHIQVYRGADRTPLNPMRHLFEYHHPGEPVPPLPQFEPLQVPPREKRGAGAQSGDQGQLAPSGAPTSNDTPAGTMSTQLSPGAPIPGAEGPTVIGGPGPLRPLVSPSPFRSPAPANPTTPAVDATQPPLHFAPDTLQRVGPFEVPGLFRSGASGRARVLPAADGTGTGPSIPPTHSFGAPGTSAPATSPAASGGAGQIGDGNGIGNWWKGVSPAASSNFDPLSPRELPSPVLSSMPSPPTQPVFNSGLLGMLARAGAFDPPAGGLLGLLQKHMRNNPDDDVSA